MRLARVVTAYDQRNTSLDRLVETADLDVLQLDYVWPECSAGSRYAVGFRRQLRSLHKTLYLDPKLHLITNAGGGDPRGCVEDIAQFLCEHGNPRLPVTAVRGANVLPLLEELMAEGVEIKDFATGTALHALTQSVVAAQVELGAGPLTTAWDDGSRLVVVGCYDLAAPMIAAAVSDLGWSWNATKEMAQLAVAAHLPQAIIDIEQNSGVTIRALAGTGLDVRHFRRLLLETADEDSCLRHADVGCHVSECKFEESSPEGFRVASVNGLAPSGEWLLRLTYPDGDFSETFFECRDKETGERAAGMLQALLRPEEEDYRTVQIDLFSSNNSDAQTLIRVCCQSQEREPCMAFVSEVTNFSLQSKVLGCELTGSSPRLEPKFSQIYCPVPREAIAVSVDTRLAVEWK